MKRTIILKAEDEVKKVHIICKIDNNDFKSDLSPKHKNDEMVKFTESLADKLFDVLRDKFYSSSIKRIKP